MKYVTIWLKDIDSNAEGYISLEFEDNAFYLDVYNKLNMNLRSIDLITNPLLMIEDNKRSYIINANNILYIEIDK